MILYGGVTLKMSSIPERIGSIKVKGQNDLIMYTCE